MGEKVNRKTQKVNRDLRWRQKKSHGEAGALVGGHRRGWVRVNDWTVVTNDENICHQIENVTIDEGVFLPPADEWRIVGDEDFFKFTGLADGSTAPGGRGHDT